MLKPMSIFETSEDPTLDPEAILHSLPPRNHFATGLWTLCIYVCLALGVWAWLAFMPKPNPRPQVRSVSVAVDLRTEVPKAKPAPFPFEGRPDRITGPEGAMASALAALDVQATRTTALVDTLKDGQMVHFPETPKFLAPDGQGWGGAPGPGTGMGGRGVHPKVAKIIPRFPRRIKGEMGIYHNEGGENFSSLEIRTIVQLNREGKPISVECETGDKRLWNHVISHVLKWQWESPIACGQEVPYTTIVYILPWNFLRYKT